MSQPRKWDVAGAEKEYVTTEVSIREVARRYGVSFSAVAEHARRNDWGGKRVAYQAALKRRGYEAMAAEVVSQQAVIRDESITVLRATLRSYAERLRDGKVAVTTKDAVESIRQLAALLGEPEGGSDEPRNVTGTGARTFDADFLRRVGEAARGRLAAGRVLEGAAPGESEGTRTH